MPKLNYSKILTINNRIIMAAYLQLKDKKICQDNYIAARVNLPKNFFLNRRITTERLCHRERTIDEKHIPQRFITPGHLRAL
jgi:hypothetical protein